MMREEFLHFIWQHGLIRDEKLFTTGGEELKIIEVGVINSVSGPDFSNAKIMIGDTLWCGNVEIHISASDWIKHNHCSDSAYDNVVLHVVKNADVQIKNTKEQEIPTFELPIDSELLSKYTYLISDSIKWIPCQDEWSKINSFRVTSLLEKMMFSRLERKAEIILNNLSLNSNDWETTFYHHLATMFGLSSNKESFEILARSIPLVVIGKHKSNLLQLEALFFGQAGMLIDDLEDEYYLQLKREYAFLKTKFQLDCVDGLIWKFGGLRPVNFPTIRIAQFANLIFQSQHLFSKIIEKNTVDELSFLFRVGASQYWDNHYTFQKTSTRVQTKHVGSKTIELILINCIVPFVFAYGMFNSNQNLKDRAIEFLDKIGPEKNSIVSKWKELSLDIPNAFYSQALVELKKEFCSKRNCLSCDVGHLMMTKNWKLHRS